MISLTPLIQRLAPKPAGFNGLWFRDVAGAAEYAKRIALQKLPLPACWIVRMDEQVTHLGECAENVTIVFDCIIAIANVRTATAGDTDDSLLRLRHAVKNLLLGWEIEPDVRPMQFNGGRPIEYADGDIYWRDQYQFTALITNYLSAATLSPYEGITHVTLGDQLL